MAKKFKKFPFLSRQAESTPAWPWPAACVTNPRTLSFRADSTATLYKTIDDVPAAHDPDFFTAPENVSDAAVIGELTGLRSDRLFFDPGEANSSILEVAKSQNFPYKGTAAVMALESRDPFLDFRRSMAEMVAAHGLKDWDRLEELLTCYLRVNGKSNHGYIVGAFVDLLLTLAVASAIDDHCSASSSSSTSQVSFSDSSNNGQDCLDNEGGMRVEEFSSSSSGA